MHYSINLSEKAFLAYERRAKEVGLTVEEHLDRSAPSQDGFALTPEMRAGIERRLAQADAGQVVEEYPRLRRRLVKRRSRGHGHFVFFRVKAMRLEVVHIDHTAQDWRSRLQEE